VVNDKKNIFVGQNKNICFDMGRLSRKKVLWAIAPVVPFFYEVDRPTPPGSTMLKINKSF